MTDAAPDVVSLFSAPSPRPCAEYALVLMAMGVPCGLVSAGGEWHLEVNARDAERAREQLRLYVQENSGPLPVAAPTPGAVEGMTCAALYIIALLILNILQRDQLFGIDWLQAGVSHAAAIRDGEWWRAVTALGLHSDTSHLLNNIFFGAVFIFLVGDLLGWGLGLAGIVFGGALGNLLNAWIQGPDHLSIGASTSVFAAVGLMAAYSWSLRGTRLNRWIPLGAGVAVLAFIGMGGNERTDVLAHVTGLGAGGLFGFAFGTQRARLFLSERRKRLLGVGAAVFFILAWALALGV
ncbi:MAG: rhomboid family intramembrane serine protease [Proteobacteria bacterium]|nr:rhomboid family intramembrane serine protease [Pseudomonadota bacterium]